MLPLYRDSSRVSFPHGRVPAVFLNGRPQVPELALPHQPGEYVVPLQLQDVRQESEATSSFTVLFVLYAGVDGLQLHAKPLADFLGRRCRRSRSSACGNPNCETGRRPDRAPPSFGQGGLPSAAGSSAFPPRAGSAAGGNGCVQRQNNPAQNQQDHGLAPEGAGPFIWWISLIGFSQIS